MLNPLPVHEYGAPQATCIALVLNRQQLDSRMAGCWLPEAQTRTTTS